MGRFLEGVGALLKVAQMPSIEERSQRFSIAPSNRVIEINDETLKPAIQELIAKGHTSRSGDGGHRRNEWIVSRLRSRPAQ